MSRVLVTGATGSLGSALARRLIADGADVVALVMPGDAPNGLAPCQGQFERREGDVRDPDALARAMKGIDTVYHLAGIAVTLNRLHLQMEAVNVVGTRNVAEAAATAGVQRLVHTSSISAIGYPPRGEIADETFDFQRSVTTNSYMITKRAGEQELLRVGRRTGLPVVVVNSSAVIAPYSHRRYGWASLVDTARRGRLSVYPPGGVALCGTEDFVNGHLAAMEYGRPGERYIISTTNLTHRELFTMICRTVGAKPPSYGASPRAVRAVARLGALWAKTVRDPMRSPFLVPENAELAVNTFFYNTSKAEAELGFEATTLTDSVVQVRDWLEKEDRRVAVSSRR